MRNMMSQVRNYRLLAISCWLLALVLTGCKGKNDPVNPFDSQGNTENPNWVITVENDMSSSITAIVQIPFTNEAGVLAAFIGNDCCGIGEYDADKDLYWLYISPASESGGEVQLRFYFPRLKRIFDATTTFPFKNGMKLGTVSKPYTPEWDVAESESVY